MGTRRGNHGFFGRRFEADMRRAGERHKKEAAGRATGRFDFSAFAGCA